MEAEFNRLNHEIREIERKLARVESSDRTSKLSSPEQTIEEAMKLLSNLGECSEHQAARERLGELVRRLNVRLWLSFMDNLNAKKPNRVLQSGIITAGPIEPETILKQLRGGRTPVAGDDDGNCYPVVDASSTTIRQQKSNSYTKGTVGVPTRACHPFV